MPSPQMPSSSQPSRLTREDVVRIVYGQPRSPIQRFTQDSPVLADVWIGYAENPEEPQDLLLTPYQSTLALPGESSTASEQTLFTPGKLAKELLRRLSEERKLDRWKNWKRNRSAGEYVSPDIAYNQSTVAAQVWFDELVRVVLPMSHWYATRISTKRTDNETHPRKGKTPRYDLIHGIAQPEGREALARWLAAPEFAPAHVPPDVLWAAQVIGIITLEHKRLGAPKDDKLWPPPARKPNEADSQYSERLYSYYLEVAEAVAEIVQGMESVRSESRIYLVSLNRRVDLTVFRSTVAVKADAAARLFNVTCRDLTWAVIDSGIDAAHPAFRKYQPDGKPFKAAFERDGEKVRNRTRIVGAFDFTAIRRLLRMSPDGMRAPVRTTADVIAGQDEQANDDSSPETVPAQTRKQLEESLNNGREIDWTLLMDRIKCPPDKEPANPHGTHVAGILAADWRFEDDDEQTRLDVPVRGMCPDINLYDLRVLGKDGGDEFSVMAALQFVRFLNLHRDVMAIHGVNLSLSIQHDVLNYACGRTPVCEECTRLIGAGVVVVAAAGNEGYQTLPGAVAATSRNVYQAISITDPGNAEAVITVGSTHRDSPHTFGVSYFSSRGPTGDGRSKPDLVAPGEKIESAVPGQALKRMDGTSMAAPHVSGAAALLIARHRELLGSPQRIKEILCRTATDLGREKYFQGSGMIDVLRALQSV
jgi:serine protease AprX